VSSAFRSPQQGQGHRERHQGRAACGLLLPYPPAAGPAERPI